jgi:cytidylate kinase
MDSPAIALGFFGRIASEKSAIAGAVAVALGAVKVSFGDFCRDVAEYMGLDREDRQALQDIGNILARYPKEFCSRVLQHSGYKPGQSLVIEGIRHEAIVEELRAQVAPAKLLLVYVQADKETIENRLRQEGNTDQEIIRLETHPTETEVLSGLPDRADFTVSSEEIFRSPIDTLDDIVQRLHQHLTGEVGVMGGTDILVRLRRELEQVQIKAQQAKDDLHVHDEALLTDGITHLADQGGAFDWLASEDDIYTVDDLKERYN